VHTVAEGRPDLYDPDHEPEPKAPTIFREQPYSLGCFVVKFYEACIQDLAKPGTPKGGG
jgi:hypothetical protein